MVEQKLRVTLIAGKAIDQGVGKETGKGSKEYFNRAAVCFLDSVHIKKLGLTNGLNVQVTSKYKESPKEFKAIVLVKSAKKPKIAVKKVCLND
jgi:formylmethanofuran dehydrogenase subunit D